jgi:hypothetical protein
MKESEILEELKKYGNVIEIKSWDYLREERLGNREDICFSKDAKGNIEGLVIQSLPSEMQTLPEYIFDLSFLRALHIKGLDIEIPQTIRKLQNLKSFHINYGFKHNHTKFPESILQLTNLEDLDITCLNSSTLPSELSNLKKLKSILINDD